MSQEICDHKKMFISKQSYTYLKVLKVFYPNLVLISYYIY